MFKQINDIILVDDIISANTYVFVYIGKPNCSVCHGLKPQIEKLLGDYEENITFIEINAHQVPAVAGRFQVLTVPAMMLFIDGKEYLREARFVKTRELKEKVDSIMSAHEESVLS